MRTIAIAFATISLCMAAPAAAQAWLTVAGADGSFRLDMPVPFDMPPTEIEPDGTTTFVYVHATAELALRLEVIDAAAREGDAVAARLVGGSRVDDDAIIRQTQVHVVGQRTYRLIATSTPDLENDPMIVRSWDPCASRASVLVSGTRP